MVKIRSFTYRDLEQLVDLMAGFHREENKLRLKRGDPFERRTTTEIYVGVNYRGIEILVAEEAGRLVGYAYLNSTNPNYPNALVIEEIYVKPSHRGRKIAGKITTGALVYAIARGLTEVYTEVKESNAANLRSNERLGFKEVGWERRDHSLYLILHRTLPARKRETTSADKTVPDQ